MRSQHSNTARAIQQQVVERFQLRQPIGWKLTPSDRDDEAIDVTGLNQLVDYPHRDMTVTVESGMTVSALQSILAEQEQWLPLSAPWADSLTLAEALLLDLNGSLAAGSGTFRDWLLGIAAVDGQGRLFHSGGRVVKNVAGYDIGKLIVGSAGELAFPLELTLQTRPRPACLKQIRFQADSPELAQQIWSALRALHFTPAVLDLSDSLELTLTAAGSEDVVDQLLASAAESCRPLATASDISEWQPATAWNGLKLAERRNEAQTLLRVGHRPAESTAVVHLLSQNGWNAISNASRGVTFASQPAADFAADRWPLLAGELTRHQQTLVPLSGPAWLFRVAEEQRQARPMWSLQAPIKAEFDPAGLLSRIEL